MKRGLKEKYVQPAMSGNPFQNFQQILLMERPKGEGIAGAERVTEKKVDYGD